MFYVKKLFFGYFYRLRNVDISYMIYFQRDGVGEEVGLVLDVSLGVIEKGFLGF